MLTKYELICHPLFLIVSGGLNFPPLLFGALGFIEWCNYYSNWLVGNAALTALNIVAGMYCVYKIRRTVKPRQEPRLTEVDEESEISGDNNDADSTFNPIGETATSPMAPCAVAATSPVAPRPSPGCFSHLLRLRTASSDRIRHLICYDGIITTYAIIFLFWVFWLSEGTQRIRHIALAEQENELEGCYPFHERYMVTSVVCGFSYFGFVMLAGLASHC
jgi:hypothetical protein